ncbi:MAG: trypsin-like peptidase domain-containing protein, partial [Limisphaerales bacterium]
MPNLSHFVVLPCGDRSLNLIAYLAGFLACLATCQVGADQLDQRRDATVQAVEQVMPSVVNIRTEILLDRRDFYYDLLWDFFGPYYRQRPPESTYSLGSGVIVHDSGYLLTNAHVINRASRIQVVLHDGNEYEAEVVAGITDSDI